MAKFIFVTGGVVSGLGKGITAASLGRLLKEIASERLKYVYLCHLSHDNNTPDTARSCAMKALQEAGLSVGEGTESLTDNAKDVQLVVLPRFDATRCYKFHVNLK